MFLSSSAPSPEYRADLVPGSPPNASTSRPESSARAVFPVYFATATAFLTAFSSKVVAVLLYLRTSGEIIHGQDFDPGPSGDSLYLLDFFPVSRGKDYFHKQLRLKLTDELTI